MTKQSIDVIVVGDRLAAGWVASLRGSEVITVVGRLRSAEEIGTALEAASSAVLVVDSALFDGTSFGSIAKALDARPGVRMLVITPDPPPHDDVVRAMAAGALGFVDSSASERELTDAVRAVSHGESFIPADATRSMLMAKADDLGLTAAGRDARLRNLVLGLIPAAGGLTAVMSLLWRRYLGQIGVRPVDLAIDPATRLVDAFFALSVLLAIVGPLLFVGTWLDLLAKIGDRRFISWLATHRRLARLVLTVGILTAGFALAFFAQVLVALFIGPLVGALLLARVFELDDDLPAALRINRWRPARAAAGAAVAVGLYLSVLSAEALLLGPDLRPDGAHGWLAPSVLGFRAQPMTAIDVDGGREPRDALYLGGNADLYVLVDPCDDDTVEFVSVGSTRLVVIDEVSCR